MPTITLRVDNDTKDYLDAIAKGRNVSVSNLLRDLIDNHLLLKQDGEQKPKSSPISLSSYERLTLALQYRLLALASSSDKEMSAEYSYRAEVLENGYSFEYSMLFDHVSPELSEKDGKLVIDILNMFIYINHSLSNLSSAEARKLKPFEHQIKYLGFDNHVPRESAMQSYVNFMVFQRNKWKQLFPNKNDARIEAPSPQIPRYSRMLDAFNLIYAEKQKKNGPFDRSPLTLSELLRIVAASDMRI